MRIADIAVEETADGAKLSAVAVWNSGPAQALHFLYRGQTVDAIAAPGDAFAAAMVVPCMRAGEDLTVDAPVSARLQTGIRAFVDVFLSWRMTSYRTALSAPCADRSALSPRELAACWSGGVDSFFTILRERDEPITTLMTLVGFDMRDGHRPVFENLLPRLQSAANRLGKRMIVVDTNVYEVGRRYVGNADHHGAVLAGAALGLSGHVRMLYIPASWSYRFMKPHGSHPFTDPLLSSESLEVVHDGPEFCKIERTYAIAHSPIALDTLRVCWRPQVANCGRCEKCVLVALALLQAGTLDRCATLPRPSVPQIRRMLISPEWLTRFEMMRDQLDDAELRRALGIAITVSRVLRPARPVSRMLRRVGLR